MRVGGHLNRTFVAFLLEHPGGEGSDPIDWIATPSDAWIQVGVSDPTFGHIEPGERATVIVRLDAALLPPLLDLLAANTTTGHVLFEDRAHGVMIQRAIAVDVVRPHLAVETVAIPSSVVQPNGPNYSFEVAPHPVTNREFAVFLNDAFYNTDSARGGAMYFDVESGDVYMHTLSAGNEGIGADGHTIKMFSIDQAPGIEFVDATYSAITSPVDYSEHPVTGVGWYGAVKYCNWLTIDQGFGLDERCYSEGTAVALSEWRPITLDAAVWRSRDLNDRESLRLVRACQGFRLPMDDGYANADPTVDAADGFNEWFKAAAWNAAVGRNTVYGFGRDTLTSVDANYRCSGDPFETVGQCQVGGTTPVGFFAGGTLPLSLGGRGVGAEFTPRANENGFGLFDMTGNVHQWMQGRYAPSTALDQRTLRGGSWNEPASAASLKNAGRNVWATPSTAHREIGFRVVRSTAKSGDFDANGAIDLDDVPVLGTCLTGPNTIPLGGCQSADFDEDGDVDLLDLRTWLLNFKPEP